MALITVYEREDGFRILHCEECECRSEQGMHFTSCSQFGSALVPENRLLLGDYLRGATDLTPSERAAIEMQAALLQADEFSN